MDSLLTTPEYGRPPIPQEMKGRITEALAAIPQGYNKSMILLSTEHETRLHVAARLGDNWKVGGGITWTYGDKLPAGFVGVEGFWK